MNAIYHSKIDEDHKKSILHFTVFRIKKLIHILLFDLIW